MEQSNTLKDRILQIAAKYNISMRKLERLSGLTQGVLSNMGMDTGSDKVAKVLAAFPEVSAEWLLTGKGNMTKEGQPYPIRKEEYSKLEEPVISDRKYIAGLEEQNKQLKQQLEVQNKQLEAQNKQIEALLKMLEATTQAKTAGNE